MAGSVTDWERKENMNVLKYGMEGYYVTLLQYALERAGMDVGNPDGIFGRRTVQALLRFQREQGIAADGVAGKLTWAALYPYISGYSLHRIADGEDMAGLAQARGVSVRSVHTANPTADLKALRPGDTMIVPNSLPVVTDRIPYSNLLTGLMLKGLVMRFPFLTSYEIGRSVMGQRIMAVSIGRGRKRIGYNGAHHANEWITVTLLLRFLEEYAASYAEGGSIGGVPAKDLYDTATLHMVPLVNPDGVDLVTGALNPMDSYYAQASALASHYPGIPFPDGWKSNISGVDLNLQYPAGWEIARRIKFDQGFTRPGPRDYVGSEPLIMPESRAMAKWTRDHDFALTLSYHTQGKVIYWQYGGVEVPGAKAIGEALSRSSGYALERTPDAAAYAGYKDWFIDAWRRPGFTVEAGSGDNPLPLSQFSEIYRENLPILVRGILLSP